MGRLLGYFGRGLVLLAPIAITVWACYWVIDKVDGLIPNLPRGVSLAITIVIVTIVGFFGSNFITRAAIEFFDRLLDRVPLVRLLYNAVRDVLNAVAGETRRFDQPVSLRIDETGDVRLFGFVTRLSLDALGLPGHVSVYCPHSYNFSGQLVVVAAHRVEPLDRSSSDVMAFVVSGGVSGLGASGEAATT